MRLKSHLNAILRTCKKISSHFYLGNHSGKCGLILIRVLCLFILLIAVACAPAAASSRPASSPPFIAETVTTSPLLQDTATPKLTISPSTKATSPGERTPLVSPTLSLTPAEAVNPPCPPDSCTYASQYFLARPIFPPGNDIIDPTYRFGSTQSGKREPHHGVEMLNVHGTPVFAAAEGEVVVAGDDREPTSPRGEWPITFYGPYSYFYGNLVVIEHQVPAELRQAFPNMPQKLYSLYAHLSEISVKVGNQVQAGEQIGQVGLTGIATGSHLHFEVRLDENTYENSRNPELWLAPHQDDTGLQNGGIAGRIMDTSGNSLSKSSIVLEHLPDGPEQPNDFEIHLLTYEEEGLIGMSPWEESFAVGDLPPGKYRISFPHYGLQEFLVEVLPGRLIMVTFRVDG